MGALPGWRYANELARNLAAVRAQTGKSLLRQIREILGLKLRATHFGISDYFDFRLFSDEFAGRYAKEHVAGWRMLHWLDDQLNPPAWRNLVFDKLCMYALLKAGGLPIPRLHGLYERRGRRFFEARDFATLDALGIWLRGPAPYPLFAKPVFGDVGSGDYALLGYDAGTDELLTTTGQRLPLAGFLAGLDVPRKYVKAGSGYLFQEQLIQHDTLRRLAGSAISSVRIVVLADDTGIRPFRALWKVIAGRNVTDNYLWGEAGNLLAAVKLETGQVERVVRGYGMQQEVLTRHPDTHAELVGIVLPEWERTLDLVTCGARLFPMLPFQHWDIAFTERGPVVLEVNVTGGTYILQYASGQGLYDEQLRAFVSRHARR
jgi:hypothetical protein